jgi:Tol biopolymer transport system component/DNA-binding winged helix-turn-helix (wHTH) protein
MGEPATPVSRCVRFGVFELDLESGELRKAGARLNLPDQPFRILTALVERPGQLVTREELRERIWSADTYVDFEHGLNAAIKRLRDVLGDSADTPRFIETLPRRGYRLIAEVSHTVDRPQPTAETAARSATSAASERRLHPTAVALAIVVLVLAVGSAVWWAARARPSGESAVFRTHTRLTFGPGLQTNVTFSPDGRFIAYAGDRAGNFDIWVQPVAGGDPVQITRSPAQDTQPDWSPDGSTLVFRSDRGGGGLFLVPALGGPERQLTGFGEHPRWSPDGSEILFLTGLLDADVSVRLRTNLKLFTVSLEGAPPRPLLESFLGEGQWSWVAGHPDGRISAIGIHRTHGTGFFTVTRTGDRVVASKQVPLGDDSSLRWSSFQWSRDGSRLYLEANSNTVQRLWRVRVDPGSLAWLSAERLTTGAGHDVGMRLSADGRYLAFSTQSRTSRVWAFPLDAVAGRLMGPGHAITEDGALAGWPALSPDGSMLSFVLRRPGAHQSREMWATSLDTGASELLAGGQAFGGCWSVDATKVAFSLVRYDKVPWEYAHAYRALGGAQRFLSPWSPDQAFFPSDWTVDGQQLLGSYLVPARLRHASLALWPTGDADARTPDRTLLALPDAGIFQAKFSPNRRWISMVVARNTDLSPVEVAIMPSEPVSQELSVRVAPDHQWPDKPRWSPDGRILYFLSRHPGSYFNLWGVRIDPERGEPVGEPFAVTNFDSPAMAISPDVVMMELSISARHAVFPMTSVTGSIWMLDNVDR